MTEPPAPDRGSPAPGGSASRLVARNAIFRTGGEVVAKLASIAFFVAVARELGGGGFGDFVFALSFTTVLILLAGFGTEELVAREVARDRARVHEYLSNVVALKAASSVAILLLAALVVNLAGYDGDVRTAVYLVGAGVAVENLGRTWHSVFQAFQRMEFISISLILQRVVTAAAGIAVLLAGKGLLAVSAVYLGGALLGFITNFWAMRRFVVGPRLELDRSRWWPIMKMGIPIGLVTVLFTVLMKVDQSLLSFLGGESNVEVGLYGAAFRLVEATWFITWGFSAAMLPWLARQEAEDTERIARGYEFGMKVMLAVLLPVGLVFTLLAEPLIDLFYGSQFEDAVLSLQLLGAVTVFYGLNSFASVVLIARDRPSEFTKLLVVVAVANIVLNVILIPPHGAEGAAFAAAASGLLLTVLSIWKVTSVAGRVSLVRAFSGPLVGGLAMAAVIVGTGLPLVPVAALGTTLYALVVMGFERGVFPDDFALVVDLVRRRGSTPGGRGDVPAESQVPAPFEA
jgi:O-antigen/teichoic acid export membrane protein